MLIMKVSDHAHAATLSGSASKPTHFARAASALDQVARQWVFGNELYKLFVFVLLPQLFSLTSKRRRLVYRL